MNYTVLMTNDCNMSCLYCYEKNKKKQSISYDSIKAVVKFIENTKINENKLVIHGGEPLLEFRKIQYFINELNKIKNNSKFELYITTNATLLDEISAKFLKENFDRISFSLDGSRNSHNNNRIFCNGQGTYDLVVENIKKFFKNDLDVITARMTVNEKNVSDLSENIFHLIGLGFKKISPVVDQFGEWNEKDILELKSEFLKVIENAEYDSRNVDLGFIKDALYKCQNSKCNGGVTTFTINTDGRIYPCIVANGLDQFCIGDVEYGIDAQKRDSILKYSYQENFCCIGCGRYDYCEATRCKLINKIQTDYWNIPSLNICKIENLKVDLAKKFL